MPKTKFQEVVFTLMMVIVMVYGMICYNISLNVGGMKGFVFIAALKEMVLMVPIAFVIEMVFVGHFAKKKAFQMVDLKRDNPLLLGVIISVITVAMMCPLMSLAATLLYKPLDSDIIATWLQTIVLNMPMALLFQLLYAGPLVRWGFRKLFLVNGGKS